MQDLWRRALRHAAGLVTIALIALTLTVFGCQSDGGVGSTGSSLSRPGLQEVTLTVRGMHCDTCPITVRTAARSVPGVLHAKASREEGTARVTYDPSRTTPEQIAAAITEAGYPATPESR